MSDAPVERTWVVAAASADATLAAFVRHETGATWGRVRDWIRRRKLSVDGAVEERDGRRLRAGSIVELRPDAPARAALPPLRIVHADSHVVVVDKPAGLSSVPFTGPEGRGPRLARAAPGPDRETALSMAARLVRRGAPSGPGGPLRVVHRLDRATSGLLVFARGPRAERMLAAQFREHSVERAYSLLAHGAVEAGRRRSFLLGDRGDGLRGSAPESRGGKEAVTEVTPVERLRRATACEARLWTGRTHQVRIHLAEEGHPVVGETVYVRDYLRSGGVLLPSTRLMLHARSLGFEHPAGSRMRWDSQPPPDFQRVLDQVRSD